MSNEIVVKDIGLCFYNDALAVQQEHFESLIAFKLKKKDSPIPYNLLLVCEHYPVITIGKSGKHEHLLVNNQRLLDESIQYFEVNRGGDITIHNPKQLVLYPILDLDYFFNDVKKYMWSLEEVVIKTLLEYNIFADRSVGETGVWINLDKNPQKIAAMGVKMSRWVSMHGLALNINNDLSLFDYIIPCGISNKSVTSMRAELGVDLDMEEVKNKLINNFFEVFNAEKILSQ